MHATAKVTNLHGNPAKPESAEHIITFPGGSVSVCRTSNNEYWAHIAVHHGQVLDDVPSQSKNGLVVGSRIDYDYPASPNIVEMTNMDQINHITIRIKTN